MKIYLPQKGSNSYRILAFLAEQDGGTAHASQIEAKVDPWAFGGVNRVGPMQTLLENKYVVKVGRGVYQLTVEGFKVLDQVNGVVRISIPNDPPDPPDTWFEI